MTALAMSEQTKLLPDDVLNIIFTLAKRRKRKKDGQDRFAFRGHDFTLQKVFYKLSQQPGSPLKKYFVFSDTGPIPYSPTLNESISKLQLAGLVGRENPNYEVLFLMPSAETYFKEVLSRRLSKKTERQFEEIAEAFLRLVKSN